MSTAVITVPTLFPDELKSQFPESLNPEKSKAKLDELLSNRYRIKIMNDFVYGQVAFTHYVLEKEV